MIYLLFPFSFLFCVFLFVMFQEHVNERIENKDNQDQDKKEDKKVEEKYEDKYWDKYRKCSSEYAFNEEDLQLEQDKYIELNQDENKDREKDEELKLQAYEYMKNKFLLRFKNSFILENTPLGNVNMCYNHEKESFEYYSDKTIPYRYLEPVARKYVSTFHCKGLYTNMEEELKEAKKRKEEEEQRLKEEAEKTKEEIKKTKDIFARLKSYNTTTNTSTNTNIKTNSNSNKKSVPNHMKAQLLSKIQSDNNNNSQLLKESSNRYTHQGRFSNFSMLKGIDRKTTNKNYVLTYSEFRKKTNL